jgi:hypothetical protein
MHYAPLLSQICPKLGLKRPVSGQNTPKIERFIPLMFLGHRQLWIFAALKRGRIGGDRGPGALGGPGGGISTGGDIGENAATGSSAPNSGYFMAHPKGEHNGE